MRCPWASGSPNAVWLVRLSRGLWAARGAEVSCGSRGLSRCRPDLPGLPDPPPPNRADSRSAS